MDKRHNESPVQLTQQAKQYEFTDVVGQTTSLDVSETKPLVYPHNEERTDVRPPYDHNETSENVHVTPFILKCAT